MRWLVKSKVCQVCNIAARKDGVPRDFRRHFRAPRATTHKLGESPFLGAARVPILRLARGRELAQQMGKPGFWSRPDVPLWSGVSVNEPTLVTAPVKPSAVFVRPVKPRTPG